MTKPRQEALRQFPEPPVKLQVQTPLPRAEAHPRKDVQQKLVAPWRGVNVLKAKRRILTIGVQKRRRVLAPQERHQLIAEALGVLKTPPRQEPPVHKAPFIPA